MSNPIIALDNINVTFHQKKRTIEAVKNVSVHVERGDVYGIVGYSGAGKSTLVRVINLLQEPTSGSVIVNDETFSKLIVKVLKKHALPITTYVIVVVKLA